jgi:hypothetical protein
MKAIKINSAERTIQHITINDWREIAPAIGNGCTLFACPVSFDNGDTMYIDDEGLYNHFDGGIIMEDWYCPIVGNVIILGTDYEGESVDAVSTIEELSSKITFVSKQDCITWQDKATKQGPTIYFV